MKNIRMAKGWTLVGTNAMDFGDTKTRRDKIRRQQRFDKAIRNLTVRSAEKMEEDAEKSYKERSVENDKLLKAYADKKLKSKAAIKKAKALKKRADKKEKNDVVTEAVVTA